MKKQTVANVDGEDQVSNSSYVLFSPKTDDLSLIAKEILHISGGAENLAIFPRSSGEATQIKKAMEIESSGTSINIAVQIKREKGAEVPRHQQPQRARTQDAGTVFVSGEGKSFADIIKSVKADVNIEAVGLEVVSIRHIEGERAIIRVRGGAEKASILRDAIAANKDLKATMKKEVAIFHIYDMEEQTSEEDIISSLQKILPGEEEIEVTSIRAARNGGSNATVRLAERSAEKLAEHRHIRIGWISCRVARRLPNRNCTRCWSGGHKHWQCTGPDRRGACFNCGVTGHQRMNCTSKPFCPVCKKEGHRFNEKTCNIPSQKC